MTLLDDLQLGSLEDLPLGEGAAAFARGWQRGWTVPPALTVADWADEYRHISRAAGSEPGEWRTDRTPYLREIMECLSTTSPVREVVFKKSSQVGGTECLNNWIGYIIHHAPAPAMVVMPTINLAEEWSKQRLATMIAESPALAKVLPPSKARSADNTTLSKAFPAGHLFIAGANSSASLRSKPVMYLAMDEIDEYEQDLNEQGSPLDLAERRTTTFPRRKIFKISTPTVKGASAIDAAYDAGDQRQYVVPCPHCGREQVLRIENLSEDGLYLCHTPDGGCGALIEEHHKTEMLAAGRWVAQQPGRAVRSYHLNALYSPIGLGDTWAEVAEARRRARRDPEYAKTFTNTLLGESFETESQKVEPEELKRSREGWPARTLPRGALLLTIGIDVQHNRFAVLFCGWGRGEQCWFADWVEVPGDPTREEDWKHLDDVVFAPIVNAAGLPVRAECIAIDSGNWTHEVYNWVRKHQARGVIAVKGSNQPNRPVIGKPTPQDVAFNGRLIRNGVQLWNVGVSTVKDSLGPRLIGVAEQEESARRVHFAQDLPDEFFAQLTAERYDLTLKRWIKRHRAARNEAWDCWVYAYAAACHPRVRLHVRRDADWAALEAKLEPPVADLFASPATPPQPAAQREPAPLLAADPPPQTLPSPAPSSAEAPRRAPVSPFAKEDWLSRR